MPRDIAFVGDICLAGRPSQRQAEGARPLAAALRAVLGPETCLVATVEAPVSDRGHPKPHKACLRAAEASAAALQGFDIGLLGNNHTDDFGAEAARDTQDALRRMGCQPAGYGANLPEAMAPAWVDLGGVKLAILSFCCLTTRADGFATERVSGVAPLSLQLLREAIQRARQQAELVIVCPHWGVQGAALPTPDDIMLARAAIEAGAHAVVGTHAHVAQACEIHLGAPIAYGLGNYLFDDLDVAYVDHAGQTTGRRYEVRQSEQNRTSLVVSLRPVRRADGWALELASRWLARQDEDMALRHERLEGPTAADRLLASRLSRLPLDLTARQEPTYLCSVHDGILVYNHRLPALDRLSFARACLVRLESCARAWARALRRR